MKQIQSLIQMIECWTSGQPRSAIFRIEGKPSYHVKFKEILNSPFNDLRSIYSAVKSLPENSEVTIYNDNGKAINSLKYRHDVEEKRVQRWIVAIYSECERKNLDTSFEFILPIHNERELESLNTRIVEH